MSTPEVLHSDPAVTCGWNMPAPEVQEALSGGCNLCVPPEEPGDMALCSERCTGGPCEAVSGFAVERSDGASPRAALPDEEFFRAEACDAHLIDVMAFMIDGSEDVRAVVSFRWDMGYAAPAAPKEDQP